jgi:hypothetical protein
MDIPDWGTISLTALASAALNAVIFGFGNRGSERMFTTNMPAPWPHRSAASLASNHETKTRYRSSPGSPVQAFVRVSDHGPW